MAYDAPKIVELIRGGSGPKALYSSGISSAEAAKLHQEIADDMLRLQGKMEGFWEGPASEQARAGAGPLVEASKVSGEHMSKAHELYVGQGSSFSDLKIKVEENDPGKKPESTFASDYMPIFTDRDEEIDKWNEKAQKVVDGYNVYNDQSMDNSGRWPTDYGQLGLPPGGADVAVKNPETGPGTHVNTPPDTSGTGGHGGRQYTPSDTGGPSNPISPPPQTHPSGTPQHPGGPGTQHPPAGTTPSNVGTLPPPTPTPQPPVYANPPYNPPGQGPGYPGLAPFGPGFGPGGSGPNSPGSGRYGSGGFGPGGSGSGGPGAGQPGSGQPGAGRGVGAAAPHAEGGPVRGGPAAGAAGRGGGPAGMGGMGAGRGGQGGEDDEHQRPEYLLEADPDEVFGSDERTTPPVIGL
ncbi:hypothetical protein [Amycolatopsis anabasis]|uniref:hypothetical protein n=1 Tax=Amycolatopsis anabasis TaxID=1840409 RepID=UPI00131B5D17|nr:hypothetical protein [Amycolatopsis anabasis]